MTWKRETYYTGAGPQGGDLPEIEAAEAAEAAARRAQAEAARAAGQPAQNPRPPASLRPDAAGAAPEGARAEGTRIAGGHFEGAGFEGAGLEGAGFEGTRLEGAGVEGARFEGAADGGHVSPAGGAGPEGPQRSADGAPVAADGARAGTLLGGAGPPNLPPRRRPSGGGAGRGPRPLGDELSPARHLLIRRLGAAIALFGLGLGVGVWLAPEGPQALRAAFAAQATELEMLRTQLRAATAAAEGGRLAAVGGSAGKLRAADRIRHERGGKQYIAALRGVQAQAAADLMQWFIRRWNQLLDSPQEDDRVGRRAATLSLLVGGMAANVNPDDFVPWQAEFLSTPWLAELHLDADGDGLPGKRSGKNTHDGFANVSVCHIAMALNQSVTDAQVLMMPEMRCDRPEARMSVFLQGTTFDDALTEFVRALREQRFIVVERQQKGIRLILVGMPVPKPEE